MPATTPASDILTVDLEDLTLDEIDVLESLLDAPLDALSKPGTKRAPMLRAMAVVVKRREDPDAYPVETAEERAASKKKVGTLKVSLGGSEANPPAPGA
jgi:hypothetical protein